MNKKLLLALSLFISIFCNTQKSQAAIFYFDFTTAGFTPSSVNVNVSDTVIFRWISGSNTVDLASTPCAFPPFPTGNLNSVTPYDTLIVTCSGAWTFQDGNGTVGTINVAACNKIRAGIVLNGGVGDLGTFSSCACNPKTLVDTSTATGITHQWYVDTSATPGAHPPVKIVGATAASYTPTSTGIYFDSLRNFCGDTNTNKIKIIIRPCPNLSITYTYGSGNFYNFVAHNPPGGLSIATQIWSFGDATAPVTNPGGIGSPVTHGYNPYPFTDTQHVRVIFINFYGCSDTVYVNVPPHTTGINNITARAAFIVSPNPANNLVHVSSTLLNPTFTISDLTGRVINNFQIVNHNSTEYTLDISNIPNGLYIIRANNDELTTSEKLIIQR